MAKKGKIDMSQEQIDELVLDTIKFHCADTIYFKTENPDSFGTVSSTRISSV